MAGRELSDKQIKTLEKIEAEKKRLTFVPNAIDPRFGMEWALCCDMTTNCTCDTPREIHA